MEMVWCQVDLNESDEARQVRAKSKLTSPAKINSKLTHQEKNMKTENNSKNNQQVPFFARKQESQTLVVKTGIKAGLREGSKK